MSDVDSAREGKDALPGNTEDIPDDVRSLIRKTLDSIELLDVLLLLRAHAGRALTIAQVSAERRSSESSITQRLAQLRRHGLVLETPDGFQYAACAETDDVVKRLVELYRERRTTIIKSMFEDR